MGILMDRGLLAQTLRCVTQNQVPNGGPEQILDLAGPVDEVLQASFGEGYYLCHETGHFTFASVHAAMELVERVLYGKTADEAIDWLESVLSITSTTGTSTLALWNVAVEERVRLTDQIELVPFDDLQTSKQKNWLSELPRTTGWDLLPTLTLARVFMSPPRAALCYRSTIESVLHPKSQGPPPGSTQRPFEALDNARLALTLSGTLAPFGGLYWFTYENSDLQAVAERCMVNFVWGKAIDRVPETLVPWPEKLCPCEAQRIVSAFAKLKDPLRSTMHLSLKRFDMALREPPHGDQALDLAIALESLVLKGNESGENAYRIALRAALLLGGALDQKTNTRKVVRDLYSLRSKLVHAGKHPQGESSREKVIKASNVCRDVIKAVLLRGEIPDWDTFELDPADCAD